MGYRFNNHDLVSGAITGLVRPTLDQIIHAKGRYVGQRRGDVFGYTHTTSGTEIGAEIEGPEWGVWREGEEYYSFFRKGILQRQEKGEAWAPLDELGFVALSGIVESLREAASTPQQQG